MVTSATYRQSSRVSRDLWRRDPDNRLLARDPDSGWAPNRSGTTRCTRAASWIPPSAVRGEAPPTTNIWEPVGFVGSTPANTNGTPVQSLYRRSLYTFFRRTAPAPFATTFDSPTGAGLHRRERSNTPLQALQLLNDVQHPEAARALATRMMTEGGRTTAERITFAYRTCSPVRQPRTNWPWSPRRSNATKPGTPRIPQPRERPSPLENPVPRRIFPNRTRRLHPGRQPASQPRRDRNEETTAGTIDE